MTTIEPYSRRTPYPVFALLAAGLFVVATNAFVITGLLPDIAATFHVSTTTVSYSITYYAIMVAVASPVISIGLPRVSRTHLIAAGLLLVGLGTLLAATSPTMLVFTLGRLVAGLGGAALVPAATAAGPALVPEAQRGRALAIVGFGFTLAAALGSPLGTALGALGGWRLPMFVLGFAGVALALLAMVFVRGIPLAKTATLGARLASLNDRRILLALVTALLIMCGFNIVYIFTSSVTRAATGGSGAALSVILLVFGVSNVIGSAVSGPLTDRVGARTAAVIEIGVEIVALVALVFVAGDFAATAVVFGLLGVTSAAATVPVQHRLVAIDPATAALALSWYTTAIYVGISLAPIVGTQALALGGLTAIPFTGAATAVLGLAVFLVGFRVRAGRRATRAVGVAGVAADSAGAGVGSTVPGDPAVPGVGSAVPAVGSAMPASGAPVAAAALVDQEDRTAQLG